METPARLPILIRRSRVFELVVAGRTYPEIQAELGISEDTVARDMLAISDQVVEVVRDRVGAVIAVALANYQYVVDEAKRHYSQECDRVGDWYDGKLDYISSTVVTKTLATEELGQGDDAPPIGPESQPIEVKRTRRLVRPPLMEERLAWLRLVMDATRLLCELTAVRKALEADDELIFQRAVLDAIGQVDEPTQKLILAKIREERNRRALG